jgi:hypothetical protein
MGGGGLGDEGLCSSGTLSAGVGCVPRADRRLKKRRLPAQRDHRRPRPLTHARRPRAPGRTLQHAAPAGMIGRSRVAAPLLLAALLLLLLLLLLAPRGSAHTSSYRRSAGARKLAPRPLARVGSHNAPRAPRASAAGDWLCGGRGAGVPMPRWAHAHPATLHPAEPSAALPLDHRRLAEGEGSYVQQVHLSLGADPSVVLVSWVTPRFGDPAASRAFFEAQQPGCTSEAVESVVEHGTRSGRCAGWGRGGGAWLASRAPAGRLQQRPTRHT